MALGRNVSDAELRMMSMRRKARLWRFRYGNTCLKRFDGKDYRNWKKPSGRVQRRFQKEVQSRRLESALSTFDKTSFQMLQCT